MSGGAVHTRRFNAATATDAELAARMHEYSGHAGKAAHKAFMVALNEAARREQLAEVATLKAQAEALAEALDWLESYLRDTPHHNAPAAANARKAISAYRGGEA